MSMQQDESRCSVTQTPAQQTRFLCETEGTLSQRHSHQLIDSIRKSWIPLVKHHYVRTTPNWAVTNWPWMNPQIDFSSHKHGSDKQVLLWLINLDSKWMLTIRHTHERWCKQSTLLWESVAKDRQKGISESRAQNGIVTCYYYMQFK